MTDTASKMTDTASKMKPQGLVGSLLTGPAMTKLVEEAGKYAVARAERLTTQLTTGGNGGVPGAGLADGLKEGLGRAGPGVKSAVVGAKKLAQGKSGPTAAVAAAATSLREKITSAFGGIGGATGQLKMTNIEESIDIGLPVDVVYNQWTQFEEFPKFMKGVESVELTSETESTWRVKVFKSHRSWKATTNEEIPDRRIVWTSEGGKGSTKGTISFHALADDLTRVLLAMEYYPSGFFEKTGNLWRAGGRRTRLDLKHFRRFISLNGEATGSWRGEIRDNEVVSPDGGDDEDQRPRDDEAEARDDTPNENDAADSTDGDDEPEDEYDEDDEYNDDEDGEEEEEEEEKARPRERKQPARA